jgi:hypothetical protein
VAAMQIIYKTLVLKESPITQDRSNIFLPKKFFGIACFFEFERKHFSRLKEYSV